MKQSLKISIGIALSLLTLFSSIYSSGQNISPDTPINLGTINTQLLERLILKKVNHLRDSLKLAKLKILCLFITAISYPCC